MTTFAEYRIVNRDGEQVGGTYAFPPREAPGALYQGADKPPFTVQQRVVARSEGPWTAIADTGDESSARKEQSDGE